MHYLSLPAPHFSLFCYKTIFSKVFFFLKNYFLVQEVPLAVTSNTEQNSFLSNSPFSGYGGGEWLGCTLQCAKSLFYIWVPTLCNLCEETNSEQIFSIDEEVDSWSC